MVQDASRPIRPRRPSRRRAAPRSARQAMATGLQETDVLYKPIVPGTAEPAPKGAIFTLLNEAFPESTTAQQIYSQKVEHRSLSVRPATNEKDAREARRKARLSKLKKKRKPRPLSAKEKRELRVFEVPKDSVRYDPPHPPPAYPESNDVSRYSDFEKVNALWNQYISEILAYAGPEPTTAACGPVLLKADYHGALLAIEDCRCKARIGLSGICVKETKNMLEIVTANNTLLKIPKEKTLFLVKASLVGEGEGNRDLEWRIWGDQFMVRSGERAAKRFSGRNIHGRALLEL